MKIFLCFKNCYKNLSYKVWIPCFFGTQKFIPYISQIRKCLSKISQVHGSLGILSLRYVCVITSERIHFCRIWWFFVESSLLVEWWIRRVIPHAQKRFFSLKKLKLIPIEKYYNTFCLKCLQNDQIESDFMWFSDIVNIIAYS